MIDTSNTLVRRRTAEFNDSQLEPVDEAGNVVEETFVESRNNDIHAKLNTVEYALDDVAQQLNTIPEENPVVIHEQLSIEIAEPLDNVGQLSTQDVSKEGTGLSNLVSTSQVGKISEIADTIDMNKEFEPSSNDLFSIGIQKKDSTNLDDLYTEIIRNVESNLQHKKYMENGRRNRLLMNSTLLLLSFATTGGGFFIVSYTTRLPSEYNDSILKTFVGLSFGRLLGVLLIAKASGLSISRVLRDHPRDLRSKTVMANILAPIGLGLGYAFYDLLLKANLDVSKLSAITSTYVAIPILYGIIVYKEKITRLKILGMLLTIAAVVLLSLKTTNSDTAKGNLFEIQNLLLLAGVILCWGSYLVLSTVCAKQYGWSCCLAILITGNMILSLISSIWCLITGEIRFMGEAQFWVYIAGSIIMTLGYGCYVKLTSENEQSTYTALSSLWIVVPIILGILILKEEPSPFGITGIFLALAAIYVLAK